ncbi:hypothetical protein IscW_ISCW004843 [Ixodes scapularis]|uniref:BTB domain-containing protein n=1 Tax=Ixodes scapularis TaxID=6945 RepID=B7PE87_IXOSC|nr:hypothetical protein IscW_ISCW004843 [Ixodes scapularis]|eukprot:XP_002400377.1 hypothetical protein IscW_ISCW004843 [Ixodes scapularis]
MVTRARREEAERSLVFRAAAMLGVLLILTLLGTVAVAGYMATEFTLDESGDLTWKIPDNAESMPFFSCETFEVFLGNPHYIRFFGTFAGHVIEFRLAQAETGWDEPFSYLHALEEGYFSDAVITAEEVVSLVADMHRCASSVVDCFSAKVGPENSPGGGHRSGGAVANAAAAPARLCYVVGQALRECAVAASKLLLLCDLFSRHKHQLSREERRDLIKYCVSRLPIFMNQLQKLLEAVKRSFGNLSFTERTVIAAYVVPELFAGMEIETERRWHDAKRWPAQIESSLDSLFQLIAEAKCALDLIISRMSNDKGCSASAASDSEGKATVGQVLNRSLRNSLNVRELVKLRSFYEKVFVTFISLMRKKESFCDMGSGSKIRSVAKKLEQFIDEIPMLLLRIEELRSAVLEKQSWKEWKFLFKLGTSKVTWVLNKLVSHRSTLKTVVAHLCDLVARDQFTSALVQLGVLTPASGQPHQNGVENDDATSAPVAAAVSPATESLESLCVPPPARDSRLAKDSLQLLLDGKDTDMSFEIVPPVVPGYGGESSPESGGDALTVSHRRIEAHRVVVATRCNWFKKALLSGMRESIDRQVFRLFLEYLYRGCLDSRTLATEQLVELMQLGDRYEVDMLKQISEDALRDHLDEDSALFLLNLADQLNARNLRNSVLEFVAINKDVVKSEGYFELPKDLQTEIMETITWFELRSSQRRRTLPLCRRLSHQPRLGVFSLLDMDEFASALNISGKGADRQRTQLPLTHDSAQLEVCVEQLRDVVGEAVPREALVQVSLAADYDVNRALNFFFA